MTILDQTAPRPEGSNVAEAGARVTRPALERDAPIRNWATLFGPAWGATGGGSAGAGSPLAGSALGGNAHAGSPLAGNAMAGMANAANTMLGAASQTLADAVGQGYRVINEYLAQGQRQAEALRFPDWSSFLPGTGGAAASSAGAASAAQQELQQQLFRRLMQYGMDFAALYFEMLSRAGWPAPPGGASAGAGTPAAWTEAFARAYSPAAWAGAAAPNGAASSGTSSGSSASGTSAAPPPAWPFPMPFPWAPPAAAPAAPSAPEAAAPSAGPAPGAPVSSESPDRVFVSVASQRRVESVLELRRGSWSALAAHALRPEGHEAPAIRGVTIEARPEESLLRVSVVVPAEQGPGVYNGMIVDTASNLPRGTLTVRVLAGEGE